MTPEVTFPTREEIAAFEARAHQLRAEAFRSGMTALGRKLRAGLTRLRSALHLPQHA